MTGRKRRIFIGGMLALCLILLSSSPTWTYYLFPVQQKPEKSSQRVYDYYLIIDETDGRTIMYVPLIAHVGDEVLSEENKLYTIVRIEENKAYARFKKRLLLTPP